MSRPARERRLDRRLRGAVAVAVDERVLGELAALDHALELVRRDEVVVAAVDLAGRIGRVVYETENSSWPANSASRRRVSVVLPAPDGDETMTRTPRSLTLHGTVRRASFDVLHLLAHLLELGLGLDDRRS